MLQEIACDEEFDLKAILPPSCFVKGGRILCSQMQEALRRMHIHLTPENFRRLWQDKLDLEKVGSISTRQLLRIMSLNDDGLPLDTKTKLTPFEAAEIPVLVKRPVVPKLVPTIECPRFKMLDRKDIGYQESDLPLIAKDPKSGGISFPKTFVPTWEAKGPGGTHDPIYGCGDRHLNNLQSLEGQPVYFDNVIDSLKYKFELPYQAMMVSFEHLDKNGSNRVTEDECYCVLREYGLPFEKKDLSAFLKKILAPSEIYRPNGGLGGDRPPQTQPPGTDPVNIRPGLVPYKRLLAYYQDCKPGSVAHKIIERIISRPTSEQDCAKLVTTTTPKEAEEGMVKLLHAPYIKFLRKVRNYTDGDGGIPEDTLRAIMSHTINREVTNEQWTKMKNYFHYLKPGIIDSKQICVLFGGISNIAAQRANSDFDIEKFRCRITDDSYKGEVRDEATLLRLVEKVLRKRLHHIDKSYKYFDQAEINMLTKEDFDELLTGQGLKLLPRELDFLWGLLDKLEPGRKLHNYRQVMSFFYNRTRPLVTEYLRQKRYEAIRNIRDPNLNEFKHWCRRTKKCRRELERNMKKTSYLMGTFPPKPPLEEKKKAEETFKLCERASGVVLDKWEDLKRAFIDADPGGSRNVTWDQFQEILHSFKVPLGYKEIYDLGRGFQPREKGYVNYIRFLEFVSEKFSRKEPPPDHYADYPHKFTNLRTGEILTLSDTLRFIRDICFKKYRTLREAFRKLDVSKEGKISVQKLNDLLKENGLVLSENDEYHLMAACDKNMDGLIDVKEFLQLTPKI
ncbi:unnamed protein product [Trichobilharzia szidati]|nr:unnamed protein product [Trichobilharzia szidati]